MENNVIKKDKVVISEERQILVDKPQFNGPQVMVHKKDGVIESIDVICTCGRKIHIVCEYETAKNDLTAENTEEVSKEQKVDDK